MYKEIIGYFLQSICALDIESNLQQQTHTLQKQNQVLFGFKKSETCLEKKGRQLLRQARCMSGVHSCGRFGSNKETRRLSLLIPGQLCRQRLCGWRRVLVEDISKGGGRRWLGVRRRGAVSSAGRFLLQGAAGYNKSKCFVFENFLSLNKTIH